MQDNTTHVISSRATTILHSLILEQAAFYTQIMYNFCRCLAKIILQS
jgi:hypothetical protein